MSPNLSAARPPSSKRWLRLSARILSVAVALFLSLFALDAFDPRLPLTRQIIGFAVHLIPSLVLAANAALAWRFPRLGGGLYFAWAGFYLVMAWGKVHWTALALISGPLALVGLLFILQGRTGAKKKTTLP